MGTSKNSHSGPASQRQARRCSASHVMRSVRPGIIRGAPFATKQPQPISGKMNYQDCRKGESLLDEPRSYGYEKLSGKTNFHGLCLGEYRMICFINDSAHLIDIVKAGLGRDACQ